MTKECPFCPIPQNRIIDSNEMGFVIRDGFPISPGHTLIIPKRHVGSFFEISQEERDALLGLLDQAQKVLDTELNPDGFNIGVNEGEAAGQTINHAHVHIIPRRKGDVQDPRGGVRWVIPDKAKYW